MNLRVISILLGTLLFSFSGFSKDAISPFSVNPFAIPNEYDQLLSGYRNSWQRMTGFEYSGLHWNQFIVVYLNKGSNVYKNNYSEYLRFYQDFDDEELDEDEIPEPSFLKYPEGTVVLKENFIAVDGVPDTPVSITMMIKRGAEYDPLAGNWEYVQFDPKGNIILSGDSKKPTVNQACANCHINIADRDYIFANYYSKSK